MVDSSQGIAMSDPRVRYIEKTISAQNTFSNELTVTGKKKILFSAQPGTGTTVTIQRKRPGGSYVDIFTGSAATAFEKMVESVGNMVYHIGVKTGNYGSGNTTVAIYW